MVPSPFIFLSSKLFCNSPRIRYGRKLSLFIIHWVCGT
uniref:Uncharacterized protein n=1 Tax=Siphoviridae sp. cteoh1 TaxID=2826407 RepID=A0A8S5QKI3_9CAUD|nr:MAG TPA: hypothetical protein [Siphoviridae sp. cteoh1]